MCSCHEASQGDEDGGACHPISSAVRRITHLASGSDTQPVAISRGKYWSRISVSDMCERFPALDSRDVTDSCCARSSQLFHRSSSSGGEQPGLWKRPWYRFMENLGWAPETAPKLLGRGKSNGSAAKSAASDSSCGSSPSSIFIVSFA